MAKGGHGTYVIIDLNTFSTVSVVGPRRYSPSLNAREWQSVDDHA